MARPRHNAHPDANQKEAVGDLRMLGFWVKVVSQEVSEFDLLIAGWDNARQECRLTTWEWKTETGEFSKKQQEFIDSHTFAYGGRCVEDVLREYGRLHGCTKGD